MEPLNLKRKADAAEEAPMEKPLEKPLENLGPLVDGLVAGEKYVVGISIAPPGRPEVVPLFFIPQQTWIDHLEDLFEKSTNVCPCDWSSRCHDTSGSCAPSLCGKEKCTCLVHVDAFERELERLCFPLIPTIAWNDEKKIFVHVAEEETETDDSEGDSDEEEGKEKKEKKRKARLVRANPKKSQIVFTMLEQFSGLNISKEARRNNIYIVEFVVLVVPTLCSEERDDW